MANSVKGILRAIRDGAIDLVWPRTAGSKEKPPEFEEELPEISQELLDRIESALTQQAPLSQNRMVAVDRKLLSLFGLTSLLATLTTAFLAGAASIIPGNVERTEKILIWIGMLFLLYIMVQLTRAVLATIKGLERSNYASQTRDTMLQFGQESESEYRRRQIRDVMYVSEQHEWATNRKVEHIQVAYRAIRNTIPPFAVIVIVAVVFALMRVN